MTKPDDFKYDVFISYSHQDEAWVFKTLLPRLEAAGLRVCIDYRDFLAGRAVLLNIQDAAAQSRHTLLVLTPRWTDSEWTLYESLLTRTADPAGWQRRIVPLMLEQCDLPPFLGLVTFVDFTRPEREEIAWRQLLTGLGAPPEPEAPEPPTRAGWHLAHPYPMPPNFTGRAAERELLSVWLATDVDHPLLVLRALGGFGKSALSWHWLLHDVDPAAWPKVVWGSFYEGEASFDRFLAATLVYLRVDTSQLGPRPQVEALLRQMQQTRLLLVLDGFERELRAYSGLGAAYQGDDLPAAGEGQGESRDCLSPLAEHFLRRVSTLPQLRGKVLLTSRLCPRVLEAHGSLLFGCREKELTQLQPADAVTFFRLEGIRGSRAEIEVACAPYGYHPLSLRLLAGLISHDLQQPGDILAARHLDLSGDLIQRQHHVLTQAYNNLTLARQQLLSRIACFRGPVDYNALHALAQQENEREFEADLRALLGRGLLHHDRKTKRYDLHPIVRRYAYDRLADPAGAHAQLRDYFAAVPTPEQVQRLEDLAPVIELYHHTVRAGQYDEAIRLFHDRITRATYYQFGAYQLRIELLGALFPDGEDHPPRLKDESAQAWTLNTLANSYSLSGRPGRAVPLFEQQITIREKQGDKKNLAVGLGNLATQQMVIGALRAAEANLRRQIDLCREIKDEFWEAVGHQHLGQLLTYRGQWAESIQVHEKGIALAKKLNNQQIECVIMAYSAQRALLVRNIHLALTGAQTARELADIPFPGIGKLPRDILRADWLLGAALRPNGQLDQADRHLIEALTRCRSINAVDAEANILLDLARLRRDQGQTEEALQLAREALIITERSGYVLQGADVNLFLAELALAEGDKEQARVHARQARQLARCDGPPDYTYKVAYDEAGAMLERLRAEG